MILRSRYDFVRQNMVFYLTGMFVVLGMKLYYSQADCDSLLWILTPTTRLVELFSGISFTYLSGTGYVNHSLRLLIAPSCSGVQFMMIAIATLAFSFVHRVAGQSARQSKDFLRIARGLGWIGVSVIFSWLFTVLVNSLRIMTAIYLPMYLSRAGLMGGLLTPERLHTAIGVVVYFTALLILYRLAGYAVRRLSDRAYGEEEPKEQFRMAFARKCIPPVFWYFFITLGLPFLNRAYLKGEAQFAEFAVLITCCLGVILLPYCAVLLLGSRNKSKND